MHNFTLTRHFGEDTIDRHRLKTNHPSILLEEHDILNVDREMSFGTLILNQPLLHCIHSNVVNRLIEVSCDEFEVEAIPRAERAVCSYIINVLDVNIAMKLSNVGRRRNFAYNEPPIYISKRNGRKYRDSTTVTESAEMIHPRCTNGFNKLIPLNPIPEPRFIPPIHLNHFQIRLLQSPSQRYQQYASSTSHNIKDARSPDKVERHSDLVSML